MLKYITITGIYYDTEINDLHPGQIVVLRKEPTNKFDMEAIMVLQENFKKIGYVAKSYKTQAKGTYSAGRLYDRMDDEAKAKICFVSKDMAIAQLIEEDIES